MKTALAIVGALLAAAVQAQETSFPQKAPIEITVLFPAGTSADVTARLLADGMSKQLGGAKVLVVNRPGAGGAIGYKYVASQKPDGYSIVWNSNSISTTFHSGMLPFDYHEFDAVARVLVESPVIAVRGDSKWKTLPQLVAEAKSRPKGITIGNSGIGSHTHISSVALFKAAGVEAVDVPFGAAQVVPSLLGGQVDAVLQLPAALSGYVKSGQVRLLASLTSARDQKPPSRSSKGRSKGPRRAPISFRPARSWACVRPSCPPRSSAVSSRGKTRSSRASCSSSA